MDPNFVNFYDISKVLKKIQSLIRVSSDFSQIENKLLYLYKSTSHTANCNLYIKSTFNDIQLYNQLFITPFLKFVLYNKIRCPFRNDLPESIFFNRQDSMLFKLWNMQNGSI